MLTMESPDVAKSDADKIARQNRRDSVMSRLSASTNGFRSPDGIQHVFKHSSTDGCYCCATLQTTIQFYEQNDDVNGHEVIGIYNTGLHNKGAGFFQDPDTPGDYDELVDRLKLCLDGIHKRCRYVCKGCSEYFATYREFVLHSTHPCVVCAQTLYMMCAREEHGDQQISWGKTFDATVPPLKCEKVEVEHFRTGINLRGWFMGVYLCKRALPKGYVCPDCLESLINSGDAVHQWSH